MKKLITIISVICIFSGVHAQKVGIFTDAPQAPLHIMKNVAAAPGGYVVLGDTMSDHLEMDVNYIQSNFFNNPQKFYLQQNGGDLDLSNGGITIDRTNDLIGFLTSNPTARFHFNGSGQVNSPGGMAVFGNTNEAHLELDFDQVQAFFNNNPLKLNIQKNGGNLDLSDGGITIDRTNGLIGFLTTNPVARFHFNGSGQVNSPGGMAIFGDPNEAHLELDFDRLQSNYGANALTLRVQPDGGNVNVAGGSVFIDAANNKTGIGTTSPGARLHIKGSGIGPATAAFKVDNALSQHLIHVQDNGFIGLNGNIAPSSVLDLFGDVEASAYRCTDNFNTRYGFDGTGVKVQLFPLGVLALSASNTLVEMGFGSSQKVLIGSGGVAAAKLHIKGTSGTDYVKVTDDTGTPFVIKSSASDGFIGMGIDNPSSDLHIACIDDDESGGLTLDNVEVNDKWRIWPEVMGLRLYHNDQFLGVFDDDSGNYYPLSDRRLKTNIQGLESVLDKVTRLRPSRYQFLHQQDDNREFIGFIAQEVKEVFPEMVLYDASNDINTLNYNGMSVVAIKAIQEMMETIDGLEERIAQLEDTVSR